MHEKEIYERINRLENVVKHLVLTKSNDELLQDPDNSKFTFEEHYKKDQEHKSVFKKFLQSISK